MLVLMFWSSNLFINFCCQSSLKSATTATRWSARFNKIHGALRTVHVSLNNARTCPQMLKKAQWPPNNSSNLNGIEISCLGSDAYSQWAKPYQKLQIIYPKQSALDQVTHSGPDLRGGRGPGPRPPTNRGPPTKPDIVYLSFMLVVYKTDQGWHFTRVKLVLPSPVG